MAPDLRRLLATVIPAALALLGCDKGGGSTTPGGKSNSEDAAATKACAKGDREVGEQLVSESRAARLGGDPPSFTDQRASLAAACEGGCGVACLEAARLSETEAEARSSYEQACTLGEAIGCALAAPAELEAATKLCEGGELVACAAMLRLQGRPDGQAAAERWAPVLAAAERGCASDEGRSCSAKAWIGCAILGQCDAAAIEVAQKAVQLCPTSEVVETLALVQCHAGELEAANQSLASACEAGTQDSCGRSCVELRPGRSLLVREAARETYDKLTTFIALQTLANDTWYAVLSAVDDKQLADFDALLTRFVPAISEPANAVEVPAGLVEQYPELIEALRRSPNLDKKQITYWYKRLPEMTDEQRANLFESMRNQWWILPGEGSRSPGDLVEDVSLAGGGLSPTWPGG